MLFMYRIKEWTVNLYRNLCYINLDFPKESITFETFMKENDQANKMDIMSHKNDKTPFKNKTTAEVLYGFGNYSKSIIQEEDSDCASDSKVESHIMTKRNSNSTFSRIKFE